MKARCAICPHGCDIQEGHTGFCRARGTVDGAVTALNYGRITSMALDPIEKKPLYRFRPGSLILSVGSFGCNLKCPFCQNCEISMADGASADTDVVPPEKLADRALSLVPRGNIGVAYTYNEPLIGYEYVRDCAALIHEKGLKNVLVTNGYVCEKPLLELLPLIDAMNIDLKGFTESFYRTLSGDLETVKRTITLAARHCHVEVTTLVIPGENDSDDEMAALSSWLSAVDPEIPLHLSRFFPRYKYAGRQPTPPETLFRLRDIAMRRLKYVYLGNV
jgi:pyruvate formate lyase activating enzyme